METSASFIATIKKLIAKDDLKQALSQLKVFFEHSAKLDEVILQSARFEAIRKQIRLGTINTEDKTVELTQLRIGILDLLRTVEEEAEQPTWSEEVNKTAKTVIQQAPKIYNIDHIDNANFYWLCPLKQIRRLRRLSYCSTLTNRVN